MFNFCPSSFPDDAFQKSKEICAFLIERFNKDEEDAFYDAVEICQFEDVCDNFLCLMRTGKYSESCVRVLGLNCYDLMNLPLECNEYSAIRMLRRIKMEGPDSPPYTLSRMYKINTSLDVEKTRIYMDKQKEKYLQEKRENSMNLRRIKNKDKDVDVSNFKRKTKLTDLRIIAYERKDVNNIMTLNFILSDGNRIVVSMPITSDAEKDSAIYISPECNMTITGYEDSSLSKEEINQAHSCISNFAKKTELNIFVLD